METRVKNVIGNILKVPFILLLVVIAAPFILFRQLKGLWLIHRFRSRWKAEGKHILFIYSDSTNWKDYVESNVIPAIETKAVFLNWSKRLEWEKNRPLEAKILWYWGGDSEFNPMAIIFESRWKVKTIRFYKAFKELKHGKDKLLQEKESELYDYL